MNFKVYTRKGCPYCDKVKAVLGGKGLSYSEYVLDIDFNRESFYRQFGNGSTFPQVLMDGKQLGGCTETVQYLREQKLI